MVRNTRGGSRVRATCELVIAKCSRGEGYRASGTSPVSASATNIVVYQCSRCRPPRASLQPPTLHGDEHSTSTTLLLVMDVLV